MLRPLVLFPLLCCCVCAQKDNPQQAPVVGHVQLSRYGDLLRQRGIELTEPALVNALKSTDPSVRFLAAMKLAEDKQADTIPAIKDALDVEKNPRTYVNIALALGLLGDPSGSTELRRVCADGAFPPEFRLYAVRYMFDLQFQKEEACLRAVQEIVLTDSSVSDRQSALELLIRFKGLTESESRYMLQLVGDRLDDPEPTIRMAAGQCLAQLGGQEAARSLERAITREKDAGVRSVLEKDLKKLKDIGSR